MGLCLFIIIVKGISRAPIHCTSWKHRVLYNNTNNARTHAHMHAHTYTHTHTQTHIGWGGGGGGIGTAVKKSLEILNGCVFRAALKRRKNQSGGDLR